MIKGPWIHQNIIETVKNIKSDKKISGGVKVNESDGFCAALPYFLYGYDFKSLEKIIKIAQDKNIEIIPPCFKVTFSPDGIGLSFGIAKYINIPGILILEE